MAPSTTAAPKFLILLPVSVNTHLISPAFHIYFPVKAISFLPFSTTGFLTASARICIYLYHQLQQCNYYCTVVIMLFEYHNSVTINNNGTRSFHTTNSNLNYQVRIT